MRGDNISPQKSSDIKYIISTLLKCRGNLAPSPTFSDFQFFDDPKNLKLGTHIKSLSPSLSPPLSPPLSPSLSLPPSLSPSHTRPYSKGI